MSFDKYIIAEFNGRFTLSLIVVYFVACIPMYMRPLSLSPLFWVFFFPFSISFPVGIAFVGMTGFGFQLFQLFRNLN